MGLGPARRPHPAGHRDSRAESSRPMSEIPVPPKSPLSWRPTGPTGRAASDSTRAWHRLGLAGSPGGDSGSGEHRARPRAQPGRRPRRRAGAPPLGLRRAAADRPRPARATVRLRIAEDAAGVVDSDSEARREASPGGVRSIASPGVYSPAAPRGPPLPVAAAVVAGPAPACWYRRAKPPFPCRAARASGHCCPSRGGQPRRAGVAGGGVSCRSGRLDRQSPSSLLSS